MLKVEDAQVFLCSLSCVCINVVIKTPLLNVSATVWSPHKNDFILFFCEGNKLTKCGKSKVRTAAMKYGSAVTPVGGYEIIQITKKVITISANLCKELTPVF